MALANEFRKYRPKLVLGFGEKTPLASPDHWQAMQITDAAVFYSRLTKWDDYFAGLPVHTILGAALLHAGVQQSLADARDAIWSSILATRSDET